MTNAHCGRRGRRNMKFLCLRVACFLLLVPCAAFATVPARAEYQAALRATPNFEHGAVLFAQCVVCHGDEGQGLPDGSTPRIAGQHFRVIVKQLVDFRYGKRWDFRMEQRANQHLGAFQDIADVASYLSQQPRKSVASAGSGDTRALGATLYGANCASCHGPKGEGDDDEAMPMLAGQHPAYLLRQMYDAVDGRRPTLTQLHAKHIKPLDFEQLRAVADFLSRLGAAN
ncbi:MAG: c-type cytochrome [Pseudomonadota bacterium]